LAIAVPTILVWGVTFVNTKALLADFSSLEILAVRFVLAYAALCAMFPRRLEGVPARDEACFALAGLSGATGYQFVENLAIHWTNASNVSIIISICPMLTALASQWMLGEKAVTRRFAVGFVIAMAGVAMVSLDGVKSFSFRPAGDLCALGAAVSWAVYSVLVSRINGKGYAPGPAIRRVFFWALVGMVPLAGFGLLWPEQAAAVSCEIRLGAEVNAARFAVAGYWIHFGFLGLLASAACFVAWNAACERLGTVRATVGIYMIPAVTVVFAWLLLGERLTGMGAVGAVLTLAGVVWSGRR
jgi:drug/metabolite transporter (DMT)-like permease